MRSSSGAGAGSDSYAEALRELFELDQQVVDAVAASELPLVAGGSEFNLVTIPTRPGSPQ